MDQGFSRIKGQYKEFKQQLKATGKGSLFIYNEVFAPDNLKKGNKY
ncbi:hypothetical protein ACFL3V_03420 [Nanoarchaeota archaeon]